MPFSFIDVEIRQSRRIIFLFFTLVVFYFVGAVLIYSAFSLVPLIDLFRYHYLEAESFSILPSIKTILILLAIASIAAGIHWVFSIRNMIKRILSVIGAKPIDPEDRYHLLLKNIVDEISVATGGKRIEPYVVPSRYLNAFALSDFHGRAIIGITEGLLTRMNRRQLESVIAHEAGHLVWGDCLLASISCSMAAVYAGLLRMMFSGQDEDGALYRQQVGFPARLLPLILVVFIMRFLTLILNTWISREREIRADATSVRLTRDPLGLSESLYIISKDWRGDFLPGDELYPIFIINPCQRKLEESYGLFADLFATHPPIRKRLDILLDMGHSNYTILESNIKEKPKNQEEIPVSYPESEKKWYALNENIWLGPFSLVELSQLKWLVPFTWVTKENEMQVRSAYEYKEVNQLLKKGLPSDFCIHTCPACSQDLGRVYYEGVPIWRCKSCNGRLIKIDQLSRIIVREEINFSEKIKEEMRQIKLASLKLKGKYIKESPSSLKCPSCGNIMNRTFYKAIFPYRMEIDVCNYCRLFWFDQNELEIIQYLNQDFVAL